MPQTPNLVGILLLWAQQLSASAALPVDLSRTFTPADDPLRRAAAVNLVSSPCGCLTLRRFDLDPVADQPQPAMYPKDGWTPYRQRLPRHGILGVSVR